MSLLRLEPELLAASGGLVSAIIRREPGAVGLFAEGVLGPVGDESARKRQAASPLNVDAFQCPGPAARERLTSVLSGEGLVVSTGQQPQLFGGPLYVLYKALTAIRAALDVERRTGTPCLAVFWVASDDHDWQEVGSVTFLDREETLRRIEIAPPASRAGRSVGPSLLPDDVRACVQGFLQGVNEGVSDTWSDALRGQYAPGRSFSQAFIGLMSSWVGDLPIAFLDSAHPQVRQTARPLVQRVLEERAGVDEALGRGCDAVTALGYRPQLARAAGAIPVFRDGPRGRYRMRETAGGIQADAEGVRLAASDLLRELESEPEIFSPSAALRPVLESWLLPVAATVLGPGEIAYWAQIGSLFTALEVPMPAVLPRDSWRVLEPRIQRLLNKTGVTADDLRDGGAAAAAGRVEEGRPRSVEEALLQLEDAMEEGFEALETTAAKDLPGLRSAVGKSRSQAFSSLAALRKTLDGVIRDREATTIAQLSRAALHLFPEGKPQERVFAAATYACRFGQDFLDSVCEAARIARPGHASGQAHGVAGGSPAE